MEPVFTESSSETTSLNKDVIRVLSYNIHHGVGIDNKLDLERIAKVIKSVQPDVVSLQEVDQQVSRSNNIDQAKELARLTNMQYVFGSSIKLGNGKYGNAVLTKLPIEGSKTISLPGKEKRSALYVTLKTSAESGAGLFKFIATHLALENEAQVESIELIDRLLDSNAGIPVILTGDFNAVPQSSTMKTLEKKWENATSGNLATFPVEKPDMQIDYIMFRPAGGIKVLKTYVLDEPKASDHRPIFAELKVQY